jgi:hypothetical protein
MADGQVPKNPGARNKGCGYDCSAIFSWAIDIVFVSYHPEKYEYAVLGP